MSDLEKRLISAMAMGIRIEFQDGHRWIISEPTEYFDFDNELCKHGIKINDKIYGGLIQALDIIDECLLKMDKETLLEMYWYPDDYITSIHEPHNRIDIVSDNSGGLY